MTDMNKDYCKEFRDGFEKRIDKLEARMNWFYILAITSLATFVLNIFK